jgi:regulator of cell morphogenesis and NO signaling
MRPEFSGSDKIGDIVARFPNGADILKEYQIDFCCGGQRPLSTALSELGLDEAEVLGKLQMSYDYLKGKDLSTVDWREEKISELVDHILNTHHVFLKRELPQLSELVTTILRAHGASHGDVLKKVHKLFHTLKMDIEQHLITEEEVLFPLIREYGMNPDPSILAKILPITDELEKEHDGAGDIIKELRKITGQYGIPEDVCTTFENTFEKLEALESDLFQHIHLENNILFPRLGISR